MIPKQRREEIVNAIEDNAGCCIRKVLIKQVTRSVLIVEALLEDSSHRLHCTVHEYHEQCIITSDQVSGAY